ncbi:FAST kinase domain-containing protein 1, mitochondrial [Mantella aurantiaca]
MFRWSSALRLSLRWLHTRNAMADPLLQQLQRSTNKYHIFQLIGIHRPMLTMEHVTCAMNLLWQFHKVNPKDLRSAEHIRKHPEFLLLCGIVEKNIDLIDDRELVNILKIVESFQVNAHCSLVQQLVIEGWRRLQRLDLNSLSTFAACLRRQNMSSSPLMGQIASIVDHHLDDIEDPGTLSSFICSLHSVISSSLRERMVNKTESNLEKLNASHLEHALELVEVLSRNKYKRSMLMKCDRFFCKNVDALDLQTTCSVMRAYSGEFSVVAKVKLMEEVERCDHPDTFADLFAALSTIVDFKVNERLEMKLLNFVDELSLSKLQDVLKTMAYMTCTNTELNQRVCSQLQTHLKFCSSEQLCSITEAVVTLGFRDDSLNANLKMQFKRRILSSFLPNDVVQNIKAMSLLSPSLIDEVILLKLIDIIAQIKFHNLSLVTSALTQLLQTTNTPHKNILLNLLWKLKSLKLERIDEARNLDSLLIVLKGKEAPSQMDMILIQAVFNKCQHFIHQLSWQNIAQFSTLLFRIDAPCSPFMDRIAAVTVDNLDMISASALYPILRVFNYMNYKPPQEKNFFNACIQHLITNMDTLSPPILILTAYGLAVSGYFPKEFMKEIFSTNFLLRLDAQLNVIHFNARKVISHTLMLLNRAVCIEHPEYGVPWFHEQYCQQLQAQTKVTKLHWQIHQLLGKIFGGTNYIKMFVWTPYYYCVGFEYILDKEGNPIAYVEEDTLSSDSPSMCDSQLQKNEPQLEGAQRVAVDFLFNSACLRNSPNVKGRHAMKKRHLEILGYHVIQVPFYEWHFANHDSTDSWTDYFRKKLIADDVSTV